jgi:NTP pyrophosphatase (non-canonical NTP hydrolase)
LQLEDLTDSVRRFADERDWGKFHAPKNLVLALVGEVGELAEIFQWLPESEAAGITNGTEDRTRVEEELADVLYYLLRLADVLGVDLEVALESKLRSNALKYPIEKARGSSAKYTTYEK